MAQDTDQPAAAAVGEHATDDDGRDDGHTEEASAPVHEDRDGADFRLTRRVHVILGLVVAGLGAWLLYLSHTDLAFRGENQEPGPGYLPVLLTIGLVGLGLALTAAWIFGPRARSGDAPTLSLEPRGMARAGLVWLALVVCAFLIEPLGFLVAGEVLVILVIVVIERMRSIPSIVALLLVPPAMYLLFATLLEVQLPEGTLWP
jgi:hypothetical protein